MVLNRACSTINIVGLAIGFTMGLLISLHILDESGYDRFHRNADRIVVLHPFENTGAIQLVATRP